MIICPECGGENPQESKYCINCGIKLTDNELENETEKVQEDKRVIVNNYIYNTNEQKMRMMVVGVVVVVLPYF